MMSIIIAIILALVICLVLKGQLRTAVTKKQADTYVEETGVHITVREDRYLHTTVLRQKINRDKD